MDVNKNIERATYFINKLKKDLPNIKNKQQKDFTIDMLNSFIVLINTVEVLEKNSPLLKVVYSLLIERMYRDLFKYAAEDAPFDLKKVFREITEDIKTPFSAQLEKMVTFLRVEEVAYLCKNDETELLSDVYSDKWEKLVLAKLNYFKNEIAWN